MDNNKENKINDQMLKNIRKIAPNFCDNCGTRYAMHDFKIIKVTENSVMIHLKCESCANTYVINAIANQYSIGAQRVPIVLDLDDVHEIEKFANQAAIDKDEGIDLYNFLGKNDTLDKLFPPLNKVISTKKQSLSTNNGK